MYTGIVLFLFVFVLFLCLFVCLFVLLLLLLFLQQDEATRKVLSIVRLENNSLSINYE